MKDYMQGSDAPSKPECRPQRGQEPKSSKMTELNTLRRADATQKRGPHGGLAFLLKRYSLQTPERRWRRARMPEPNTDGAAPGEAPSGKRQTRVLVVDGSPLARQAVREFIAREEDMAVCGEAEDRKGAMAAVAGFRPDLAIVELRLQDSEGFDLIRDIHEAYPETLTLALSMYDDASAFAREAIRAGARGYISKLDATTELLGAVRRALDGEVR